MDGQCFGLVVEETICRQGGADVHYEVVHRPVHRVHDVGLVLEQVVDAFDDVSFGLTKIGMDYSVEISGWSNEEENISWLERHHDY